jgi:hypothetical protein
MLRELDEIGAVRREMWKLLQQQIETLQSAQELTDRQIIQCYERQMRVQELREKLEDCNSRSQESVSASSRGNNVEVCTLSEGIDSLTAA